MTLRAAVLLIVFACLFAFIGLNWAEFSATSTLSFGFTVVQMPVGFVMLGVLLVVVALFSTYVMYLQANWALQQRRVFSELELQRKLADQAEASRTAELLARVNTTFDLLTQSLAATAGALEQKIALASEASQRAVSEASHSLSAHLGEVEDKLDKAMAPAARN
jgi:uncharacterized membrane protein